MNEFDGLEDVYFGKKLVANKRELTKLSGLYKYCWWLKPPKQNRVHVPFNLLAFLVKVAPKSAELDYVGEKLREYGYIKKADALSADLLTGFSMRLIGTGISRTSWKPRWSSARWKERQCRS